MLLQEAFRQALGLFAEEQIAAIVERGLRIAPGRFGGQAPHFLHVISGEEIVQALVIEDLDQVPIVQPRPLDRLLGDIKAQGADQMKAAPGGSGRGLKYNSKITSPERGGGPRASVAEGFAVRRIPIGMHQGEFVQALAAPFGGGAPHPCCPLWGKCRDSGKGGAVGDFELLPFNEPHPLSQPLRPASSPIGEPRNCAYSPKVS